MVCIHKVNSKRDCHKLTRCDNYHLKKKKMRKKSVEKRRANKVNEYNSQSRKDRKYRKESEIHASKS